MKIERVESWHERTELVRPYDIAYRSVDAVDLFYVRVRADDGLEGLGAAAPVAAVTGESVGACASALAGDRLGWLVGADARCLRRHSRELKKTMSGTPAACAAVDIALHDLFARRLGLPLAEVLGRCHDSLPTSITIGIKSADETVREAEEYVGRGFDHLKVKLGKSLAEDEERLAKLREKLGDAVRVRVDANQGYSVSETLQIGELVERLNLELVEQPLPAEAVDEMRRLPAELRRRIAADEGLHGVGDALQLAMEPRPCGIFNIKLMKCGGIRAALDIALIAETAKLELMWGCMDESVISIAAALHAAYACPATRYLDLDGSFDLARDLASGGFILDRGRLRIPDAPGLGVRLKG